MNYNLLNYPGNDTTVRNPYFRTTIASVLPDILVCEEMTSQAGVNGFLSNVLLPNYAGYTAGTFIDGPDTDCEIFFKSEFFTFISNTAIPTELRNIYEFKMVENSSGDTLRIYAVHLKASSGTTNEQKRLAEVNILRNVTNALPAGTFYLVLGDFNIYGSAEPAYTELLNQSNPGYFVDLFNMPGTWNNATYAPYHTQSTRTRQFGGGANGGLDDRFDMILMSQSIIDAGGIDYVADSYIPYGNDGQHYNDSINQPPNLAVGQVIANALHYSSDHLPVIVTLSFSPGNTTQFVYNLNNGWNLLSVPLAAPDMGTVNLFPTATTSFFGYNSGYTQITTLQNGSGYWAKFSGSQNNSITGSYVAANEITVSAGWNLIGPFDNAIPVNGITTVPPNIMISSFYDYNIGYGVADTLNPGRGYWVKISGSGVIVLNQNSREEKTSNYNINASWAKITIKDKSAKEAELYFAEDVNKSYYELPPLPPAGAFDARFTNDYFVENLYNRKNLINITGADYPIEIKVEGVDLNIQDAINGNFLDADLKSGETIALYDNKINTIVVSGDYRNITNDQFVLEQNYPNPFNPATMINYSLPMNKNVKLDIYNVLGQKVAELVNSYQNAGNHSVEFDASKLSGGVYFYKLESGSNILVKKMVLLK